MHEISFRRKFTDLSFGLVELRCCQASRLLKSLPALTILLRKISLSFSYHLPFPVPYSLSPDTPISLPSLSYERASVLYNTAALYASMAAAERRAEAEGIKRALGFLTVSTVKRRSHLANESMLRNPQAAAGIFNHLTITMLPIIQSELSTAAAAGYDMTDSFLGAMREFVLAEAQECYWQQAVLREYNSTESKSSCGLTIYLLRGDIQERIDRETVYEGELYSSPLAGFC